MVGPLATAPRPVVVASSVERVAAAEPNVVEFVLELNDVEVLFVEFAAAPNGIVVKYRLTAV